MANAIEVRDVAKRYRLGRDHAGADTLRDLVARAGRRREPDRGEVWALQGVDLDIADGEALGIVGRNGAGKSTLLRVIARITEPTRGVSRTRGRVGSLLEVGTGFHYELTGRENVFLSGAIMGMSRRDIRARFDEIVAFAGVERFLDTPLKRYSSGMGLRLAFAVAAHLEPDIMLVDEILAVGDIDFQRRCTERMRDLSTEGRTVVFISHDLGAVSRLCTRAVELRGGRVAASGPTAQIVRDYYATVFRSGAEAHHEVEGVAGVRRVAIVAPDGRPQPRLVRGEPLVVELEVETRHDIAGLDVAIGIDAVDGTRVLEEAWSDQADLAPLAPGGGRHVVRLELPPLLRAADHVVHVWLGTEHDTHVYDALLQFTVMPRDADRREQLTRRRMVQPVARWSSRPAG